MTDGRGRTLRGRAALWLPSRLSVNGLKLAGTALMALYFFGASVVQNGILHVSGYTTEQLNRLLAGDGRAMLWAGIASAASAAGMVSLPIFAYLLALGVEHTGDIRRYCLTVLAFAAASEIPYDLAMSGKLWDWTEQNSLWTVLIALVTLWLMKTFQGEGTVPLLLGVSIAGAGCFWAAFLRCKFGGGFVLIAAVFRLFRGRKGAACALGAAISLLYATAPIGFLPVALCDGARRDMGRNKYAYYLFYPAMLGLFALCQCLPL